MENVGNQQHDVPPHERIRILEVFPLEIWECILELLEETSDIINIINASLFFRQLLQSRIANVLFPEVLAILDNKRHLRSENWKDLLQCRQVCSDWKVAVNRHLEIRPYHFKLRDSIGPGCLPDAYETDVSNKIHVSIAKYDVNYLEHKIIAEISLPFYQHHCPFPSRHFSILDPRPREFGSNNLHAVCQAIIVTNHQITTARVKEKVGHHFWHLVAGFHRTALHWYIALKNYANFLPNLKSLYILHNTFDFESGLEQLRNYVNVESSSFPSLDHLEFLSVDRAPGCALNKMLSANRVKVLEIYRDRRDEFSMNSIQDPVQLSIQILSEGEFHDMSENWKLTVLKLKINTYLNLSFPDILEKLNCYRDTLEDLSIDIPNNCSPDVMADIWAMSRIPCRLSKLRRLDIKLRYFCSLDFLLGLESLEYVCICLEYLSEDADLDLVKNHSNETLVDVNTVLGDEFKHSVIWELIPTLKQVHVRNNIGVVCKHERKVIAPSS